MPRKKFVQNLAFNHDVVGHIIGVSTQSVAKLATLDLKPEAADGQAWSTRQVLALAAKVHTLRVGASKHASDQAFWILCRTNITFLNRDCTAGRRYLLLVGKTCGPTLVTEAEAFDPMRMRHAAEAGIAYVVFDVGKWLNRINIERSELTNERFKELKVDRIERKATA